MRKMHPGFTSCVPRIYVNVVAHSAPPISRLNRLYKARSHITNYPQSRAGSGFAGNFDWRRRKSDALVAPGLTISAWVDTSLPPLFLLPPATSFLFAALVHSGKAARHGAEARWTPIYWNEEAFTLFTRPQRRTPETPEMICHAAQDVCPQWLSWVVKIELSSNPVGLTFTRPAEHKKIERIRSELVAQRCPRLLEHLFKPIAQLALERPTLLNSELAD